MYFISVWLMKSLQPSQEPVLNLQLVTHASSSVGTMIKSSATRQQALAKYSYI